jgi:hypothetical protein
MEYNLIVRDEALYDIFKGYDWYEGKKDGLGERFTNEVDEYIEYIHKNPFHYQIKTKNQREGVLKVFPYVIIYEIIKKDVVVFAVFPTSDNPDKKTA